MARAVARTLFGLLLAAVVVLTVSPLAWVAGAQPRVGATTSRFVLPTLPPTTPAPATTTAPPVTSGRPATTSRPRGTIPSSTSSTSTTSTTVPPTTVAPLPNAGQPPVTLPLSLGRPSGHVSPVFPVLGGLGIFALIALLATQFVLTAPGRRGRGPTL